MKCMQSPALMYRSRYFPPNRPKLIDSCVSEGTHYMSLFWTASRPFRGRPPVSQEVFWIFKCFEGAWFWQSNPWTHPAEHSSEGWVEEMSRRDWGISRRESHNLEFSNSLQVVSIRSLPTGITQVSTKKDQSTDGRVLSAQKCYNYSQDKHGSLVKLGW